MPYHIVSIVLLILHSVMFFSKRFFSLHNLYRNNVKLLFMFCIPSQKASQPLLNIRNPAQPISVVTFLAFNWHAPHLRRELGLQNHETHFCTALREPFVICKVQLLRNIVVSEAAAKMEVVMEPSVRPIYRFRV
jgi:hypothetical protein